MRKFTIYIYKTIIFLNILGLLMFKNIHFLKNDIILFNILTHTFYQKSIYFSVNFPIWQD
jgi:hypothetical protein